MSDKAETTTKRVTTASSDDCGISDETKSKKQKLPFNGNENVKLKDCLGKWVVVFDVLVNGLEEEQMGLQVERAGVSTGCRVEFLATGEVTLEKGDKQETCDPEGTLKPRETTTLPSGRNVMMFSWKPPPGKENPGYSDCWDEDGDFVDASVESIVPGNDWLGQFPLHCSLFDDNTSKLEEAQQELPKGIILLIHWFTGNNEFGIKEFLYLSSQGGDSG